jgi:outer membrane biosynthesis protein TonB
MSSVVVSGKPAAGSVVKIRALLLGCALLSQATYAHPIGERFSFHAARLPVAGAEARLAAGLDIVGEGFVEGREVSSFAAFEPLPDAERLRAEIASLEERGDTYTPRYAELSEQLGRVLQADGEHHAALAAFDRSFHVNRRQEGLRSPMQASLLRAQVESELALGDFEAADLLNHSLFSMQQALFAERPLALAEAHREAADWNMQYYLHVQQLPVPGGVTEAEELVRAERLAAALGQYHRALALLTAAAEASLPDDKAVLERRIAAVTLIADRQQRRDTPTMMSKAGLASIRQSKLSHNQVFAEHGAAALQRAASYADSAAPAERATRQLELADWYLLMDQHERAREAYAAALDTLRSANLPEQQVSALVDSGLPVRDPERELLALAREASSDFDGYIDVAFDLDRHGKARNARVLASAAVDAVDDDALERELLRQISADRFRPDFVDGVPVARNDVMLRYYFAR